jgi:hypothetical protein
MFRFIKAMFRSVKNIKSFSAKMVEIAWSTKCNLSRIYGTILELRGAMMISGVLYSRT